MSKTRDRSNSLYNIAFNSNMEKAAYLIPQYKQLTQDTFTRNLASRFPGLKKKNLKDLLDNFKANGRENHYSLHALQLYCDLLHQSPIDALSSHRLFPSNTGIFELFTWNDIQQINFALAEKIDEFVEDYWDDFPIRIPVKYSPKDMVLLCLELYIDSNDQLECQFRVNSYANSWGSKPNLNDVLVEGGTRSGVLPRQKNASDALERRYTEACELFDYYCAPELSTAPPDSFEHINQIVFDLLGGDISHLEGSFAAYCPQEPDDEEDWPVFRKSALDQTISREDDYR